MVRVVPPGRLSALISVATAVFIEQGYRRTQMEDVARALGVAKGTLYGYVESKAALFDAALRYADGHVSPPEPAQLPLRTPPADATLAVVQQRLAAEASELKLVSALACDAPTDGIEELTAILDDLYRRMERNRFGIKLVDRCAADQPELARLWFGQGRWAQHAALVVYLERRIKNGYLRPVRSIAVTARLILETIAFWAVHRYWDPSPQEIDPGEAEAAVMEMLLRNLVKEHE